MKFRLAPAFFAANCEHSKQEREDLEESKGYLIDSPTQRDLFVCGSHETHESRKVVSPIECLSCTRPSPIF